MNSIFEKNKENLEKFILEKGEKSYRADQIWRSMYVDLYDNFNDISTIPDKLKKSLENEFEFSPLKLVLKKKSKDKSTDKYLWRLHDNRLIETVLMRYDEDGHRGKEELFASHLRSDALSIVNFVQLDNRVFQDN